MCVETILQRPELKNPETLRRRGWTRSWRRVIPAGENQLVYNCSNWQCKCPAAQAHVGLNPQLAASLAGQPGSGGMPGRQFPQFASHPNLSTALLQQQQVAALQQQAQVRALQQAQLQQAQLQQAAAQQAAASQQLQQPLPANAFDVSRSQGLLSSLGQVHFRRPLPATVDASKSPGYHFTWHRACPR